MVDLMMMMMLKSQKTKKSQKPSIRQMYAANSLGFRAFGL